jgi:hypothetical protein
MSKYTLLVFISMPQEFNPKSMFESVYLFIKTKRQIEKLLDTIPIST